MPTIKKPEKEKPVLINLRVSPREKLQLEKLARLFTGGNLSHWLRHAALNYKPTKADFE